MVLESICHRVWVTDGMSSQTRLNGLEGLSFLLRRLYLLSGLALLLLPPFF